jgi:quercetin dioxygenase-like cupin family protein
MKQRVSIAVAFVLGACASAATQSVASTEPPTAVVEPEIGAVIPLAEAPHRTAPNRTARITLLARGDNAFLGKLEMEPNALVPEHRDATEEYIHVLEGWGTIVIEGTEHSVEAGTTIYMPPDALVTFRNGPARLVALQVFAGPAPAAKYDTWLQQTFNPFR